MKHQNKHKKPKTKIKNKHTNTLHTPVLLQQVLQYLAPQSGEDYLDLTGGYGGHAAAVLQHTQGQATVVDRDPSAATQLKEVFADYTDVTVIQSDFLSAAKKLADSGSLFDIILADLGVSSPHLDQAERGFSFLHSSPLDMRMDTGQQLTAATVVNTYPQQELERILRDYGEEPKARQMAQLITESRPINTTTELAAIASRVWPHSSRSHPATRLFQAIRIAVNGELEQLEAVLPLCVQMLRPDGRLAIITFHSLEDRIVKRFLKDHAADTYDADLVELTKRPVTADARETAINQRARSAKMRVAKRI